MKTLRKKVSELIEPIYNKCVNSAVSAFMAEIESDEVQKALSDLGVQFAGCFSVSGGRIHVRIRRRQRGNYCKEKS